MLFRESVEQNFIAHNTSEKRRAKKNKDEERELIETQTIYF